MPPLPPLQINIIRHPNDTDVSEYEDAITHALQGGTEAGGYLATGDDLGIQIGIFSEVPPVDPATFADGFSHSILVVFADRFLLENSEEAMWDWIQGSWVHVQSSGGRHAIIVVAMDERVARAFSEKRERLSEIQLLHVHQLGEPAIRPAMLALLIVHRCRVLIATGLWPNQPNAGHLRLFISHAKFDGLPLAFALRHQIDALGWLDDFYDVDDIPPGSDWQQELERGVGSSLIVILRTEAYDGRHWCQQEVLWADEYATPAVLVEARTNLNHPAANLPFDRIPTVRIPDGNLLRILFAALREGLRFLLFVLRVETLKKDGKIPDPVDLRVFCFHPSMAALLRACRSFAPSPAGTSQWILYPDPPFRAGTFEAAQALVAAYIPGAWLGTPHTIAATWGTGA